MPLTLAEAKFKLGKKPNWKAVDPSLITDYINEASEVILSITKPKDSIDRVGITAYDELLTLPREYASCEGIMYDEWPVPIKNHWVEFTLAGLGEISKTGTDITEMALDMGDGYCCFREPWQINTDGCRLKVYTDAQSGAEEYESIIEFYGLNADGEVIRTSTPTSIRSGEAVNLVAATGYATSVASFYKLTQVVKPMTNGIISVYAIDPDDSTEHLIATYQPGERQPNYHRYKVQPDPDGGTSYLVTALCRRRHVELFQNNDIVCVSNFAALAEIALGLWYRDVNDDERYNRCLARGRAIIAAEALKFRPAGQYPPPIINLDGLENRTIPGY